MLGSTKARVLAVGLALLLALPVVTAALDQPFYLTFATRVLIFALAALSLDLILGYGGLVSLGHAAFFGFAAYVVAILAAEGVTSAWVQWPVAILASGLVALLIGLVVLRTSGVYFIMITLAFSQMLYFLFVSLRQYGGDDGLRVVQRSEIGFGIDLARPAILYYLTLAILVAALVLLGRLTRARFGMVLTGAKHDQRRMAALGFPVMRYRLAAFALAGMLCGVAGVLQANLTQFVSPAYMAWTRSGELIVMVVLGGMGTLFGPVAGAAALLVIEELLADLTVHWMVVLGPILVLLVLFAKRGLWGLVERGPPTGGGHG
jgi:branched-chain amino acid transport system permease protein